MFKDNNYTEKFIADKFIIVYDKLTKPIAKYISNEFADKYKIVLWNKKECSYFPFSFFLYSFAQNLQSTNTNQE